MLDTVSSYGYYQRVINQLSKAMPAYESSTNHLLNSALVARYTSQITSDTLKSFHSFMNKATEGMNALNKASNFEDSTFLSAKKVDNSTSSSTMIQFTTNQVASNQVSQSGLFDQNSMDFEKKTSTLTFASDEEQEEFEVDLSDSKSNEEALDKITSSMNTSKNYQARINRTDDGLQLQIESKSIGQKNAFSIQGPLTNSLSLSTAKKAKDTSINYLGEVISSQTNRVTVTLANEKIDINLTEDDMGLNRYQVFLKEDTAEKAQILIDQTRETIQLFEEESSTQFISITRELKNDLQRITRASGNPTLDKVQLNNRSIERMSKEEPLAISRSIKALKDRAQTFSKTPEKVIAKFISENLAQKSAFVPEYADTPYRISAQTGTLFDLIL